MVMSVAIIAKEQFRLIDDIVPITSKAFAIIGNDGISRLVRTSQSIYKCMRTKKIKPYLFEGNLEGLA